MHLTVDSLIDVDNIITGSNNITLSKVNVKPYGCDKMYMDKDLIQDKLYQLIDQFSERTVNYRNCYFVLQENVFYFMMEMGELLRYYFLTISVMGCNFNKTCIK